MAKFGEQGEETWPLVENEEQPDWDNYETLEMEDLSNIQVTGMPFEDVDEVDYAIRGEEFEKYGLVPNRAEIAPAIQKMYPNINVESLNLYTRPLTGDEYWWNGEHYYKIMDHTSQELTPIFIKKMEESGFGEPLEKYLPESIRQIRRMVRVEEELQSTRIDLQRERQVLRQSQTLSEQAASRENIAQIEERIETLESERDEVEAKLPLRSRVRAVLTRYKYGIGGFVVAAGLVAGIVVVSTKNAVGSVMTAAGNGLTKLGQTAAKQLPAIVGAVAGFILRAAGSALAFLGKNAWLVLLAIAGMAVNAAASRGKSEARHKPHQR